jgi:hypothetical protein
MKDAPHSLITVQETYLFLSIIVQMGHNQRDMLKDYRSISNCLYGVLWKHNETRQILPYTEISTF